MKEHGRSRDRTLVVLFRADLGDPTEGAKRDASAKEGCVALWNVQEGTLLHPELGSNYATAR